VYVAVERPDGTRRATSLFQCCGCSATFTDPDKFTARKRLVLQRSGMSEIWTLVPAKDPTASHSGITGGGIEKPSDKCPGLITYQHPGVVGPIPDEVRTR